VVATYLNELGVLHGGLKHGRRRDRLVEGAHERACVLVVAAEQDELGVHEVVPHRAHRDEEGVVGELHVRVQQRQDALAQRARQHGRDDHDRQRAPKRRGALGDCLHGGAEVVVVEVRARLRHARRALVERVVRRLHGDEDDLRASADLLDGAGEVQALALRRCVAQVALVARAGLLRKEERLGPHARAHRRVDVEGEDGVAVALHAHGDGEAQLADADDADTHRPGGHERGRRGHFLSCALQKTRWGRACEDAADGSTWSTKKLKYLRTQSYVKRNDWCDLLRSQCVAASRGSVTSVSEVVASMYLLKIKNNSA